ncbi:MAG: BrnT family toxin [Nitrospiria bacterium]
MVFQNIYNNEILTRLCYFDTITIMDFDNTFDKNKSEWTKENRGADFTEARKIWNDPDSISVPAKVIGGEARFLQIGTLKKKVWTVCYTLRNGQIRIISVRRARDEEEKFYRNS